MRDIRVRYNPYLQTRHRLEQVRMNTSLDANKNIIPFLRVTIRNSGSYLSFENFACILKPRSELGRLYTKSYR